MQRPRGVRERIKRLMVANISCLNTRCSHDKGMLLSSCQKFRPGPCAFHAAAPCQVAESPYTQISHEVIATTQEESWTNLDAQWEGLCCASAKAGQLSAIAVPSLL